MEKAADKHGEDHKAWLIPVLFWAVRYLNDAVYFPGCVKSNSKGWKRLKPNIYRFLQSEPPSSEAEVCSFRTLSIQVLHNFYVREKLPVDYEKSFELVIGTKINWIGPITKLYSVIEKHRVVILYKRWVQLDWRGPEKYFLPVTLTFTNLLTETVMIWVVNAKMVIWMSGELWIKHYRIAADRAHMHTWSCYAAYYLYQTAIPIWDVDGETMSRWISDDIDQCCQLTVEGGQVGRTAGIETFFTTKGFSHIDIVEHRKPSQFFNGVQKILLKLMSWRKFKVIVTVDRNCLYL